MASLGMTHIAPLLYSLDLPSWDGAFSITSMPRVPVLYLGAIANDSFPTFILLDPSWKDMSDKDQE